ncbi:poly-gamma-glutamate hydrolase family protein [Paraburkholderia kururiensis]|uniref:poly-gamma-glutamate hydrolase family protein n=1 Tax=Paraburkholderia kururiensis TaxID=984307 RepID=UPI00398ACAE8
MGTAVSAIDARAGEWRNLARRGLDRRLKDAAAQAIAARGIEIVCDGHAFPATEPNNICNRGCQAIELQMEISSGLRGSGARHELCAAIRAMLLRVQT